MGQSSLSTMNQEIIINSYEKHQKIQQRTAGEQNRRRPTKKKMCTIKYANDAICAQQQNDKLLDIEI